MTREEAIKFSEYAQIMADGKPDVQEFYKIAEAALREQETVTNRNGLTNADHIRSMTDEELAAVIAIFTKQEVCLNPEVDVCDMCPFMDFCENCAAGGELDWLKQPYKEAPNDPT